jgi:hypothetical protein
MSEHEGGCLCGRLRFRVTSPALASGYCHCRMCQRNSGAPVVAWVTFPAENFSWIVGEAGCYRSSAHGQRRFCAHCGSYLAFVSSNYPAEVSINTASLDDPAAFPPRMHIFAQSRLAWFRTADGLPSHDAFGDFHPADGVDLPAAERH